MMDCSVCGIVTELYRMMDCSVCGVTRAVQSDGLFSVWCDKSCTE